MRTFRILVTAFLAGVILAACGSITRPTCTVTGVDTVRVVSTAGTDTLNVILRTEWCE